MKKLYNKLKMIFDTYKMWVFAAALFGTNGAQALLSGGTATEVEPVEVVEIQQQVKNELVVTCKGKSTKDHEREHHGGR